MSVISFAPSEKTNKNKKTKQKKAADNNVKSFSGLYPTRSN